MAPITSIHFTPFVLRIQPICRLPVKLASLLSSRSCVRAVKIQTLRSVLSRSTVPAVRSFAARAPQFVAAMEGGASGKASGTVKW